MKTNEAPEKIYLIRNISTPTSLNTTNDCHEKYLQEWYKSKEKDTDVEYIRTDVFIKKVIKYLYDNNKGFILTEKDIEDFRKYMED